jgi:hypothetical protein
MTMDPATISAFSALSGSAIGAMASFATTWLTQNHQDHMKRLDKEGSRRERLFAEFIDQASKAYADGVIQERLDDPAKLVPMYATVNKLRLFARPVTIEAAEAALASIVKTYGTPSSGLEMLKSEVAGHDILRNFAESCRLELTHLR